MPAPLYATCPATVVTYDDPDLDPIPDPEPVPIARVCGESLFLVTETNRDLRPDGTTEPPDDQQSVWSIRCADGHVVATPDWPDDAPVPSTSVVLALALAHASRANRPEPEPTGWQLQARRFLASAPERAAAEALRALDPTDRGFEQLTNALTIGEAVLRYAASVGPAGRAATEDHQAASQHLANVLDHVGLGDIAIDAGIGTPGRA